MMIKVSGTVVRTVLLLMFSTIGAAVAQSASPAAWKTQVETDWFRQTGTADDPVKLKAATVSAMELAQTTFEFVARSAARSPLTAEWKILEAKIAAAGPGADWKDLYLEARWLRRRIILSHPLLDFDRLLINKRPPPIVSHMCDQHLGRWSGAGPGLCIVDSWAENPHARPLLAGKLPTGSVLHPDLSFDAKRVIFSFCDHTVDGLDEWDSSPETLLSTLRAFPFAIAEKDSLTVDQQARLRKAVDHIKKAGRRRFFIYEAEIDGSRLRQLTGTASDPMVGWDGRQTVLIEDLDPCYLPGGGFVFVSTRCQGFGRCHSGRYAPTLVLYRAEGDGSKIRRISPSEVNEWEPSVLPDGRIIFTRWDYVNRDNQPFISLWVGRPDGTDVAHYYGNYTRNPCMTSEALAIPGSHKIACTAGAHHAYMTGSTITIDPLQGQDGLGPVRRITPEAKFPEMEGWSKGSFAMPYPLSEDLFLVSYSPDQIGWEKPAPRVNGYGIYLIDTLGGRELIYRDPEMSCFAPIPIKPRSVPPVIHSEVKEDCKVGTFFVQNVYHGTPDVEREIEPGSVRQLRVIRLDPQPTAGRAYSGIVRNEVVKGIVGTVPVAPDGSVAFLAPADVPLMFQLLDENNMAVMTMRSQTYVRSGETLSCVGCHEPRNTTSKPTAVPDTDILSLDPPAGPQYEGGLSFVRTVQPVLDRYCIRCHGLEKTEAELNLLGTPTRRSHAGYELGFSIAYESLVGRRKLIAMAGNEAYNFGIPYKRSVPVSVERFMAFDKNSDGKLARNEAPNLLKNHFGEIDTNGDGYVGVEELKPVVEAMTRERPDPPDNELVGLALRDFETTYSTPRDYYAHSGRLAEYLLGEHKEHVVLDRRSFQRIVEWLDLNGQYYGDYSFNRPERRRPSAEGEKSLRHFVRTECGVCHGKLAEQPLAALLNIAMPGESRLLKAPLATEGGGWGLCEKKVWPDTTATEYQQMLNRVLEATSQPEAYDIVGTCGQEPCICGSCWVRKLRAAQSASFTRKGMRPAACSRLPKAKVAGGKTSNPAHDAH